MSTMTVPALLPCRMRPARVAPAAPTGIAGPAAQVPLTLLTRRGRLVLTLAVLGAAFGILGVAQPPAFALGQHETAAFERVTVRPGETLWAIAQRATPGADPRETVTRIQSLNDLDSSTVAAGSLLLVPVDR
jgi:hypothetical protein